MNYARPPGPIAPPQDLDAEQSVLGAVLLESRAAEIGLSRLSDADFYREAHRVIWRAMKAVAGRGEPVDLVSVSAELRRSGELDAVGGAEYLTALLGAVPTTAHTAKYVEIVSDCAQLRALIATCLDLADRAYSHQGPARELLEQAEEKVFGLLQQSSGRRAAPQHLTELVERGLEEVSGWIDGVRNQHGRPRTGLPSLDWYTGGLPMPGTVYVLADTGFGKTKLSHQVLLHWCLQHCRPAALWSLEMSRAEVLCRFIQAAEGLDLSPTGVLRADGATLQSQVEQAWSRVGRANIHLYCGNASLDEIAFEAKRLVREARVRLVVIDYFELLHQGAQDKVRFLEEAVGRIQRLARELEITVLVPQQVTRNMFGEAEARYCRAIEHAADMVLQIEGGEPTAKTAEKRRSDKWVIIVKKSRMGPSGGRFAVRSQGVRFVEEDVSASPEPHVPSKWEPDQRFA